MVTIRKSKEHLTAAGLEVYRTCVHCLSMRSVKWCKDQCIHKMHFSLQPSNQVPGKDNPYHCFFAVTVFLLFFALSSYCFKLLSHKLLEQLIDISLYIHTVLQRVSSRG